MNFTASRLIGHIAATLTGLFATTILGISNSFAQETEMVLGQSVDGQLGLQAAVTPIMESAIAFHNNLLMYIITGVVALVTLLLLWVFIRFNEKANPVPAKFTHNTLVEVIWTVLPIFILIIIAVPSFAVLADQETIPDGERSYLGTNIFSRGSGEVLPAPGLTIKVTGNQWYWNYEYPDNNGASYDSSVLTKEEADAAGEPYLLAADTRLVVPVNTTVQVLVTASDVIHALAVPSFGVKVDAVPGRLNHTWFYVRKEGIYYGQCSELCGKDHAFMPIAVEVVSKEAFAVWIAELEATDDIDLANEKLASL